MEDPEIDWNEIQKEYDNEIASKISKFTGNEFSSYKSDFPDHIDLKESIQKQFNSFIEQFKSFVPAFEPHFYSDKIQNDFNREVSSKLFSNIVGFYQKLIERTKWRNKKVINRLNSEYCYPKYTSEFDMYLKSSTSLLQTCNEAIFSLQTPETDARYIELALRYDLLKYNENFAINNLYQTFKHFPLIRRREILTIASNRFIEDTEYEMNGHLLPKLIKDKNSLIPELKRLSDHMKIKFDIDSHDGQLFCYLCEKLYIQCSSMPFTIENTTDDIPLVSDPILLDRLNYDFINEITVDPGIKSSFDILVSPSDKKLTKLMEKFDNKALKILSTDKVTAFLRLQFSRNKTLFQSIIQSLQTLSELREEILNLNLTEEQEKERDKEKDKEKEKEQNKKPDQTQITMPIRSPDQVANSANMADPDSKLLSEEELQKLNQKKGRSIKKNLIKKDKKKEPEVKKELNFIEMQYSIFRKEILAAGSMIKSSTTDILDNESLLELLLDLFDQYYKLKLLVIHSLIEINRNLPPLYLIEDNIPSNFRFDVKSIAFKFIELRPTLLCGVHNSCLTPLRLSVDILEKMSTSIRTMINFQIFSHNYFMNTNRDMFPFFEFPGIKTPYQGTKEEFPYSFGEFFFCLSKIPDFVAISFRIASELCTSLSVKALKFESYFLYATWEQLLIEMTKLFNQFEPESFQFNMKMSNSVSQIMTSRYLNDLHFIHEQIEKQDKEKQLSYAMKIREMANLTILLRTYLIQTDSILPTFKRQANEIAKSDYNSLIDLAYGEYDFTTINEDWQSDELLKIIRSQKNFYLSLLIAVRYNNFADDSIFVHKFFELDNHGSGFNSRPTKAMLQRQQILRSLPNILFYEPKLFNPQNYTSIFCDVSHITKDVVFNTELIAGYYMPFCIKSEIAFICGYERNFLKHYSSTDVFELEATYEVNSILSKDNKLNLFYSPTHYQCLSISNNSIRDLHQVLRFAAIRLQMNEWIRHDSHVTQTRAKTIENIYSENLLFTSPFFSRINIEINRNPQAREIDFSVQYFEIERTTYICKQFLTTLSIYESTILPEEKPATFITTSSQPAISYTLDSIKSYICDIISPPKGRPTFMTPSLYVQKCMDQFWYQCNDQFRSDFLAALSTTEQKVEDAIIGLNGTQSAFNAYSYAIDWLRLSFLRLGYFHLINFHDPSKVSFKNAIMQLNKESFSKGKSLYESNVNIISTARIGARPKVGTIETAIVKEKTTVLLEIMETMFYNEMKRIIIGQHKKQIELIDEAFSAPNQMLKPDCYEKVMKINSVHTNYLPTISSIEEQFGQELGYAHTRFCHSVYRMISLASKKCELDQEQISNSNVPVSCKNMRIIDLKDIEEELKSISEMLYGFLSAGKKQLLKTWSGYLSNVLREYRSHSELQIFLNMYITLFKSNYNDTINFKLAMRVTDLLNTLASLRDKERYCNREQIRFERRVTNEIRAEFDLLLSDLAEEIRKAKYKFVEKKNHIFNHAFTAIDRFKENPEFINDTTAKNPKYSLELLNAPIEIRDPDRRTLIKVQVQQRKIKREQRRKIKKLHEENRRLEREANQNQDEENENTINDDNNEDSYSSSSLNSENDEFDDDGRKLRKEKNIQLEMEKIRAEIDELQIIRKKLRVYNSLSSIGFINIYQRMINKVAEEKKGYSAKLLHNHRLFEEEMVKITDELRCAYNMLTNVEIDIETLKNDIEIAKEKNVKLIHWRETNLRKSGEIQKELKLLTSQNSGNVNVTQLLKKISEKQDELEMLEYENQKLDEDIYYEVREPMMQLDLMRHEITRRRAQQAQEIQQLQYELQQQMELQDNQDELEHTENSQVRFTLPKSPRTIHSESSTSAHNQSDNQPDIEEEEEENYDNEQSVSQLASSRSISQRGLSKMQTLQKENEILREKNESIRKQIQELEDQLKTAPKTLLPDTTELMTFRQPTPASARPRSTKQSKKTIVRPGIGRAFVGSGRPQTSRL